jgi:uncharacterized protein
MTAVYHPGELAVQERAGVRDIADRIGGSIGSTIPPAAREFLRSQRMAILGALDAAGGAWASLWTGDPGFMEAVEEGILRIDARPAPGDPLGDNLTTSEEAGLLVIELATRRRMRLNGTLEARPDGALYLHTRQVYANCPKYIQAREWPMQSAESGTVPSARRGRILGERQQRWIREADTFFIASSHPEGGVDASHRGGNPGFVRLLNERSLEWPDYSGNMLFQTLGNIAANPRAGLLFIDFEGGNTLQLTGSARIVWDRERAAELVGTERIVEFDIDEVVERSGVAPPGWRFLGYSRFNPARGLARE